MDPSGIRKSEASCLVCGDKASGRHYGVPSCDGCRGFFKRSIRRNLDYVCKESNQCVVDVSRRNQCQACRFRKCLAVNMKREAVQHERAPRGALKRAFPQQFHLTAASTTSSIGDTFSGGLTFPTFYPGPVRFPWRPQYHSLLQHQRQLPVRFGPLLGDTLPLTANPLYSLLQENDTAPNPAPKTDLKEDEVSSSANEHEEASPENEPPKTVDAPPSTQQKNSGPGSSNEILRRQIAPLFIDFRSIAMENQPTSNNVSESAARLLFMAVRWARSIPSFTQLSYRDQTTLLEASWCELFVLNAAQWGLVLEEAIGTYSSTSERHTDDLEELLRLRDLIARFHLLHVDHTEYACLKALVLFKPETRGLRDPLTVELLQDQTHLMLHEYCTSQSTNLTLVGTRHSLPARFGKLLLLLPIVRTVQSSTLMEVFFRNTVGNVPMEKLLTDLLSTC